MSDSKISCTNATWLFKVPRLWYVPNYLVDNVQYAEVIGRRSTGDRMVDMKMARDLIPVHIFTSQAAEVLDEGHRIMPADKETAILTFHVVTDHLIDWANYLKKERLIERDIPIEGLRQFSKLSSELIRLARADKYHTKLRVRKTVFANLRGEKYEDKLEVYNNNMIEYIESEFRRRNSKGRQTRLAGGDFEKRRF